MQAMSSAKAMTALENLSESIEFMKIRNNMGPSTGP